MNPTSLISPHKKSFDNCDSKSHKSHYSNSSLKNKSVASSGIHSPNKGRHVILSSSSLRSWGEDIFPDVGLNWSSKNKTVWAKKEINFSNHKKENNITESVTVIENTKSDFHSMISDNVSKSEEEESKDIKAKSANINEIVSDRKLFFPLNAQISQVKGRSLRHWRK